MVGALTTPETFAVYVNGAIEIPLIGVLTGSVAAVLIVEYNRLHREDRHGEIVALIHRAMVKCSLVIFPVMLLFLCVAPELMRLIYGAGYEGSAAPFRVYLLLLPIRTLNFGAILMATKKSHHVLVQSVITLVANVILTYYAVLLMGAIGAAVASVLVVYFVAVPYLVVVLRNVLACPVHRLFPWRQLSKVGMASAGGVVGIVILRRFIPAWPDVLSLALSSTIWIIGTALLLWALRLVNPLETLRIVYHTYWGKGQFAPVSSAEASSSNDS
jgi:O-antigen/teichoic acid export membrane protein